MAAYVTGSAYWAEYQVKSFCEDQVVVGGPSEGIAAVAAALGFRVRWGPTRDAAIGLILIYRDTALTTYYCDVQHIDGKVVWKTTGSF